MKKISLALQRYLIIKKCPNWDCKVSRSNLICIGNIKPSELSRIYKVKLSYALGKSPDLIVVDPPLQLNEKGEHSPHLYKDNLLCLYYPVKNEWNSSRVIAETIIPWVSLWLYYYEVWLLTGIWKGGGEHPPLRDNQQ
jgi:hypothetical protein